MTVKNAMNLFCDVQVAEEFHQMAAEGYIDSEFTMYATAWLDGASDIIWSAPTKRAS